MHMSIPLMNKNAVFIKNFTFRLRNISRRAKRYIVCQHIAPKAYHVTSAEVTAFEKSRFLRLHSLSFLLSSSCSSRYESSSIFF